MPFFCVVGAPREWPGPSFLNLRAALLKQGEVDNKLGGVMKAVAE